MKEQVSALMDGAIPIEEADHLFSSLSHDGEMRRSWDTYHLIGDAMRGNAILSPGFEQRLMQKLREEPVVLAPKPSRLRAVTGAWSVSGGWSIAASFAAVMFVGWMALQQTGGPTASIELAALSASSESAQTNLAQSNLTQSSPVQVVAMEQASQQVEQTPVLVSELPAEYLMAHQSMAPNAAYYIQPVAYAEGGR
ncbi:sigma-E factor negative regulatory protein [Methylobacillus flagellatus]|uniref:sigma-E factor negative regulatory protein n=1 Tax=Methylobacillus flagellatus TaxID=405 RepID=UPI0010F8ED06|nr:sigma-E factor negative regulatory protein [Methylobacillus flagellatus]